MQVLERTVERDFVKRVKALGGVAVKLNTLGPRGGGGWPDRLVLLPGGRVCFVELKRPGGQLTPRQQAQQEVLERLGFAVGTFSAAAVALLFVQAVKNRRPRG